jgi:PAS domain-containing protein
LAELRQRIAELEAPESECKQAEKELRRSEEKYRSLVSNIPDVVWTSDEDYGIVFVGSNVERLTGYTQKEEYKLGDWMKWLDGRLHPDDMEKANRPSPP